MEPTNSSSVINWEDMKKRMEESIRPGASLAGSHLSALMNTGYTIVCGITIQNWTNMELSSPQTTINTGSLSKPPCSVAPGQMEVVVAHKYPYSLMGTSGVVSWLLGKLQRRIVVLWEVPFKPTNVLAVGITPKGVMSHNSSWYNVIESRTCTDSQDLNVKRGQYYDSCNEVIIEDDCIQVLGSMGTGSRSEVTITVRPKLFKYLVTKDSN